MKYECKKCHAQIETENTQGTVVCNECGTEHNIEALIISRRAKEKYAHGISLARDKDWEAAAQVFSEVISLDPDRYHAYFYRFLCRHETEYSNHAIRELIINIESLDDEDYIIYRQRASESELDLVMRWEKDREKEQENEKIKETEENYIDEGRKALKSEEWDKAMSCFASALEITNPNPDARLGEYMAEYHCHDMQELMNRAIEISMTDTKSWNRITVYLPIAEERKWRSARREYIVSMKAGDTKASTEMSSGEDAKESDDQEMEGNSEKINSSSDNSSGCEDNKSDAPVTNNESEDDGTVKDGNGLEDDSIDCCSDDDTDTITGDAVIDDILSDLLSSYANNDEEKDENAENGEVISLIPQVRKTVENNKEIAAFRVFLILKDGYLALENLRWDDAAECFDLVIEQKSEADHSDYERAVIGKFLIEYKLTSMEVLKNKFINTDDEESDFYMELKHMFTGRFPTRRSTFRTWERERKKRMGEGNS